MARKRVRSLRFSGGGRTMMHAQNYNGVANYENPEVLVSIIKYMITFIENKR
jgi:hypothetical protein